MKHYDQPRTAYQRLLECNVLRDEERELIDAKLRALNPAELQRGIQKLLRQLWHLGRQEPTLAESVG